MKKYKVRIFSDISGLSTWTMHNAFIMQILCSSVTSSSTLSILNKVRLYLRVVTVSDLMSADGKYFDINTICGNRNTCHPNPSYYRYCWPKIPEPTQIEKEVWYQYLCTSLNISIGALTRSSSQEVTWKEAALSHARWLYSPRHDSIYQYCGSEKWIRWEPAAMPPSSRPTTRSMTTPYAIKCNVHIRPEDSILISVHQRGIYTHIAASSHAVVGEASSTSTPLQQQEPDELQGQSRECHFMYNLLLQQGVILTDGSSDKGKATYAVVVQPPDLKSSLETMDHDSFIYFAGQVTGTKEDIHSYRAELTGILATIEYTNTLCRTHSLASGLCTVYCDNKGALIAAFGHKRPTPRWSCFDLVTRIRRALLASPIQWKHQHVKGHQDNHSSFSHLPYDAKGNILADYFATKAYDNIYQECLPGSSPPWTLTINDEMVSGNIHQKIKTAIFKPLMTHRWASLFKIQEQHLPLCDWGIFFRNIELQPSSERHWMTKFHAKLLPVGKNLKRRRHSSTSTCPCCEAEEDHYHIVQCKHGDMNNTYNELYDDITGYVDQFAAPLVAKGISFLLQYYRCASYRTREIPPDIPHLQDQIALGQGAFFAGLWTHQWLILQEGYHKDHRIKRQAARWLVHLIHKIQQVPKRMWNTRNKILHNTTDPVTLRRKHAELDGIIQTIYNRKPHQRLMAHCDNLYFRKYDRAKLTTLKLQKKTNWITGANLILAKYERSTTLQSERFTSYFQWDRG